MINLTPPGGIDVGDTLVLRNTFTDLAGDPATILEANVTLTVVQPNGTEIPYTGDDLTLESTGIIKKAIYFTLPRWWVFRWDWNDGAGNSQSSEATAYVNVPAVDPVLTT